MTIFVFFFLFLKFKLVFLMFYLFQVKLSVEAMDNSFMFKHLFSMFTKSDMVVSFLFVCMTYLLEGTTTGNS